MMSVMSRQRGMKQDVRKYAENRRPKKQMVRPKKGNKIVREQYEGHNSVFSGELSSNKG